MRKELKEKLLNELCWRLNTNLKGILIPGGEGDGIEQEVTLVGVDLSKSEPFLQIRVPGFKSPWTCSIEQFIPILRPLDSIYEEIEPGIIPWLEKWKLDSYKSWKKIRPDEDPKMPEIISYTFEPPRSYSQWRGVELKVKFDGHDHVTSCMSTATFDDMISMEVAKKHYIDINDLITDGLAQEWK